MRITNDRPLRVLAADDSAVMRGILRTLFLRHAGDKHSDLARMELVGVAKDGLECLEVIRDLKPDVLVLDMEMPYMNGLEVLDHIRNKKINLPVLMCSSHTQRGARATIEALARGAYDYVMKPERQRDFETALASLAQQLLPRISGYFAKAHQEFKPHSDRMSTAQSIQSGCAGAVSKGAPATAPEVVVIGVSTGGPVALEKLLPQLPHSFPVPILIVQHMPKIFTSVLAERLDRCCALTVREAYHNAALTKGSIWIAPGDMHMEVMQRCAADTHISRVGIKLHQQEPLNHCRPSVDYLFHSAARLYGAATLSLVLTGMGSDGLDGARAIHASGGTVLAQDEMSSAVWGMPARVVEAGLAASVLDISVMAGEVIQRVGSGERQLLFRSEPNSIKAATQEIVTHGML